jgi:hypothetical protein
MRSRRSIFVVTAGAMVLSFSGLTSAQSLRCNSDLAVIGDSKASVLQKCGEPVHRDSFCKPVVQQTSLPSTSQTTVNVLPCENVDEWTYKPGYGQFLTTLQFQSGNLVSIRYGDRIK